MRDTEHISEVCRRLEEAWKHTPDLRLGQLIVNALTHNQAQQVICSQVFYAEDDTLLNKVETFMGVPMN